MARPKLEVEEKSISWNLKDKETYKFLKPGSPYGYAYFVNDFAELALTKEEQTKLMKLGVITKV